MSDLTPHKILETLQWYQSIGIDEAAMDTPFDKTVSAHDIIRKMTEATDSGDKPKKPVSDVPKEAPLGRAAAVQDATAIVSSCHTIEELKQALESFDGCPLKATASHFVFADGNPQSGIMFIGDAPDAAEDMEGKSFIGKNGDFFRLMISHIGLNDKDKYYLSNIVPWRPPGERAPSDSELAMIKPFVLRHIELVNPKILVLVGAVAAKTLLEEKKGILKLRQGWHDLTLPNGTRVPVKVLFNPPFLFEQPQQKRTAWNDLLEIKQMYFS